MELRTCWCGVFLRVPAKFSRWSAGNGGGQSNITGTMWGKVGQSGEPLTWKEESATLFMGEHQHTLDDKGRLTIPAKFREGLGEECIVTRGLDQCLFVFPTDEWRQLEAKLKALPMTKGDARAFVRFLFSGATRVEFDKQGRMMLPQNLREYAVLEKDAVVIGVSSRVEIWSPAKWKEYTDAAQGSFEEIAEKIVELGI